MAHFGSRITRLERQLSALAKPVYFSGREFEGWALLFSEAESCVGPLAEPTAEGWAQAQEFFGWSQQHGLHPGWAALVVRESGQ